VYVEYVIRDLLILYRETAYSSAVGVRPMSKKPLVNDEKKAVEETRSASVPRKRKSVEHTEPVEHETGYWSLGF
jgi:hypothetical protein